MSDSRTCDESDNAASDGMANSRSTRGAIYHSNDHAICFTIYIAYSSTHGVSVSCTECNTFDRTIYCTDYRPNHHAIGHPHFIADRGSHQRTNIDSDRFTECNTFDRTIYCTDYRPNHHAIGHPHFIADRGSHQRTNIDSNRFTECGSVHHTTTNVGTNHFGAGSGRRMLGANAHWLLRNSKQWQWHV
jgi:hypothetical protein